MIDIANPQLSAWESFYVIVGSSSAALVGLQFIVITLIAGMRRRTTADSLGAFGTPTVVHLVGALLVSAIMSAPWPSLIPTSIALATCGLGGFVYGAIVIRRARRQTDYRPDREDWLWYFMLPWVSYGALALAAPFLRASTQLATFVIGAAALGLLLIGIRNACEGTLRNPVTIWVIRLGDDLYVRSVNGRAGAWFRGTQVRHEGYIQAGGVDRDVTFADADPDLNDQVDAAYRTKYRRYATRIVGSILTPEARSTTIRLVPRRTNSPTGRERKRPSRRQ